MTTIDEMDEFFNFEDATHSTTDHFDYDFSHLNATSGVDPYDIDLTFADPEGDGNPFTRLQHFSAPEEHPSQASGSELVNTSTLDITTLEAHDFQDFPRWINGMSEPTKPCTRCRQENTHCKVIKEGFRKGSCTCCVALARQCSLTRDLNITDTKSYDYRGSDKVNGIGDSQGNRNINEEEITSSVKQCEHCRACAEPCNVLSEGESLACQNCLVLNQPCSLVRHNDWQTAEGLSQSNPLISPMSPFEGYSSYSASRNDSSTDLSNIKTSTENLKLDVGENSPKVGARFSRQSVRILKDWLGLHHHHPYPTDSEREILMSKTGLNKTQITNWLANARRRGKTRPTVTPPTAGNYANAMDIPRKATPALEHMNPLERWKHSPPEHEPASATAIAKAVTASSYNSGMDSPYTSYADDGSNRSLYNVSSASSLGTSHSSAGSFASAYSHRSRGSFGSFGSFGLKGRRRRRRQAPKPAKAIAAGPARTFQCTFCTESFKTKHDWQRHEKSLHLSLERWICCPNGPTQYNKEYGRPACVYCDQPNPSDGHAETHNHSSCAEKSIEERTFYRKDHLRQHLNLVHEAKFVSWSMESWKAITPEIRSRCGFCGIVMDSWTARIDHLAEHFKSGKSMVDWKGDWGFEPQILNIVENGIPPYLIHEERMTMRPFEASRYLSNVEHTPENLIKSGLTQYVNDKVVQGITPTDKELLGMARQIIRNLDAVSDPQHYSQGSWLSDLILLSRSDICQTDEDVLEMSSSKPLETVQRSLIDATPLMHQCPKEIALRNYVNSRQMLGLTATDSELQVEACRIIDEAELTAAVPCKGAVSWFKYLIKDSTGWLADFRRRAGLPRSCEMANEGVRSKDETSIDHGIHNYARLEAEMKDYVQLQFSLGKKPADPDLQRHARLIVYGNDDQWNQTWADDPLYLHIFKTRNGLAPAAENKPSIMFPTAIGSPERAESPSRTSHWELENYEARSPPGSKGNSPNMNYNQPVHTLEASNQPSTNSNPTQPLKYFLNDANCYNRLVRELSRFVARCMSPNNPNQHIPTDGELQNQARWVIYDDDDPWNQTAADNAEWLMRFKRDAGLSPQESGPGLPTANVSWRVSSGGSGFYPPYLNPGKNLKACDSAEIEVNLAKIDGSEKMVRLRGETANVYIKGLKKRYKMPAHVFCSRELEEALFDLVKTEKEHGRVPTDGLLRARARDVLNVPNTAADDQELLEKFKAHYGVPSSDQQQNHSLHSQTQTYQPQAQSILSFSAQQPPAFLNDDNLLACFGEELFDHCDMDLGLNTSSTANMDFFSSQASSTLRPVVPASPFTGINEGDFDMNMNMGMEDQHAEPWANGMNALNELEEMEETDEGFNFEGLSEEGMNKQIEFAELHKVNTATASPWRRKASERLARGKGNPRNVEGGGGVMGYDFSRGGRERLW
ncbi:483e574b-060e-4d69-a6b5-c9bd24553dc6 [Sclerotinia trifoliorum]|uniref:483e574b-060e-4d69-a6b5-c9bd24553dc6 n=1 Tax=Sclerotinia trifoliorum TaxID=28548 RepID=A0A8H2VX38_9HELO|nr:483e574b-060e-4d69-a6b5-c9bd24553dc6 [Sclerotinia trifoliorum]